VKSLEVEPSSFSAVSLDLAFSDDQQFKEELVRMADLALYDAKRGRNQVCNFQESKNKEADG
jgi:GGDEF domain-containing protein